jgi:methylase of polypeptide subunit release factors
MLSSMTHSNTSSSSFLDVGSGTGAPLLAIVNELKKYYNKIVGVDLNH